MALDEHGERMRVAMCGCANWQQPAAVWTHAGPTVDLSLLINHSFPFPLSHPNPKPSPLLTSTPHFTSIELPNPRCCGSSASLDMSSIISFININTHYLSHSSYLHGRCFWALSLWSTDSASVRFKPSDAWEALVVLWCLLFFTCRCLTSINQHINNSL